MSCDAAACWLLFKAFDYNLSKLGRPSVGCLDHPSPPPRPPLPVPPRWDEPVDKKGLSSTSCALGKSVSS